MADGWFHPCCHVSAIATVNGCFGSSFAVAGAVLGVPSILRQAKMIDVGFTHQVDTPATLFGFKIEPPSLLAIRSGHEMSISRHMMWRKGSR